MTGQCIYCLEAKDLTDEHIIPDSMGGTLVINAVCDKCNSNIGSGIEGPFINSFLVSGSRFTFGIGGKSGKIPNPFGAIAVTPENLKIRLEDDLKPYVIPSVQEEVLPDGSVSVHMAFDKADESKVRSEVAKKIERMLIKQNPTMSKDDINKKVSEVLTQVQKPISAKSSHPTIHYNFKIDLVSMRLGYIKIAYEIGFHLFGYGYVNDSQTAVKLREAVNKRQDQSQIRGQIPLAPDDLGRFFPERDRHYVLALNGAVYIRLFNIAGLVQFEENDPRFMCDDESAQVFEFDFSRRNYFKERFIDRLAKTKNLNL